MVFLSSEAKKTQISTANRNPYTLFLVGCHVSFILFFSFLLHVCCMLGCIFIQLPLLKNKGEEMELLA